jgi:demethylmenaquinone methyltransferase/2-methoxy-6-polyprenyl-1,4-benzoquinol methylase
VERIDPDSLIEEQIAYYRARAPEYDDWWLRVGRYGADGDLARRWEHEKKLLRGALEAFDPRGDVLELAAGTGNLTCELARLADSVTALDISAEVLAIARAKLPGDGAPVELVEADVFGWTPPRRYDVVAFAFWLSHVPPGRVEQFWDLVRAALAPGGRVFLIDNAVPSEQAAQRLGAETGGPVGSAPWSETDLTQGVSIRELADGRRFRIVKRLWQPELLEAELAALGWRAEIHTTGTAFIHGTVVPADGP